MRKHEATRSSSKRRRKRGAPDWVRMAMADSPTPPEIVEKLENSEELGPLWETLTDDKRNHIHALPELIGFMVWGPLNSPRRLPWSLRLTPSEQTQQAKRVAKLARDLNKELSAFAPLDPFGLHQLVPQVDNARHFFLVGLPKMATPHSDGDSLLLRVATMAEKFKPNKVRRIKRPTQKDAWETYFVRTFAPLFGDHKNHAFLAALVNAIGTSGNWDAERVRKCLSRSPEKKSR